MFNNFVNSWKKWSVRAAIYKNRNRNFYWKIENIGKRSAKKWINCYAKSSCKISENGNRSHGWSWIVQQIQSKCNHEQRQQPTNCHDNQLHRRARRPIAISHCTFTCKNPLNINFHFSLSQLAVVPFHLARRILIFFFLLETEMSSVVKNYKTLFSL